MSPVTPGLRSWRGLFFVPSVWLTNHQPDSNQLEKLQAIAGQEKKLTKHELFIKGHDLTFWSTPLKIN